MWFLFFEQKTADEMRISDWSSDVCSSDLIIAAKLPAAFLLENVKNLMSHDKGNTFRVIKKVLEEELGYHISYKVVNGAHFVPQHRQRILIVGFREKTDFTFDDVRSEEHTSELQSLMRISYAVFCLKKKNTTNTNTTKHKHT